MDNLDKLIKDLSRLLAKKYTEQLYLNSPAREILQNWCCFLNKNNIELISTTGDSTMLPEDVLLNLINREQHKIKNKIIFPMYFMSPRRWYILTTRENAQKLVVFGSFEN